MISRAIRMLSRKSLITLVVAMFSVTTLWAGQWTALGPDGGDVRSLNFDPKNPDRIYLGTSTGTLFVPTMADIAGRGWPTWAAMTMCSITSPSIPRTPNTFLFLPGASRISRPAMCIARMTAAITGKPCLACMENRFAPWPSRPSDSNVLVAGALDGVFRTKNGGNSWEKISPPSAEIKNIESIAIDPKNPDVVYAGTWHLAWKTDDGGANWHHINKGMIDDSDVFSVIVDSTNPSVVYASACSGIYKSESAGDLFHKLQGIPFSARRTRVLKQDPSNPATVYAGTTEGLWKTHRRWQDLEARDQFRSRGERCAGGSAQFQPGAAGDRPQRRSGQRQTGRRAFAASNHGYTHRYVSSILADKNDPNSMLVGVVNDREWGGVFSTRDGGQSWQQKSAGLGGRDVFASAAGLQRRADRRHQQRHVPARSQCHPVASDQQHRGREDSGTPGEEAKGKKAAKAVKTPAVVVRSVLDARVSDIEVTPKRWLAATGSRIVHQLGPGQDLDRRSGAGQDRFRLSRVRRRPGCCRHSHQRSLFEQLRERRWQQAPLVLLHHQHSRRDAYSRREILVASREGAFRSLRFRSDLGARGERYSRQEHQLDRLRPGPEASVWLPARPLAWCSRARTTAAAGIADPIRDTRCAASALSAGASWAQPRLMA